MFSKLAVGVTTLFAIAVTVNGACDNGCSGHGTCGADDVCACYPNWRMGDEDSGDCSDRVCPFELAWVDHPTKAGSFHNYAECAGRGLCNRGTGECECFEGYTGKACQRTTCPNDCSGHGTCEYIEELGFDVVHGDYYDGSSGYLSVGNRAVTFSNQEWDNHKSMACVCDPKWTDLDCSRRMCPKGNDVLNTRLDRDAADPLVYQIQKIVFPLIDLNSDGTGFTFSGDTSLDKTADVMGGFAGRYFALTFVSTLNETYTTKPIKVKGTAISGSTAGIDSTADSFATFNTAVENALKALPHKVIDDVTVTTSIISTSSDDTNNVAQLLITFKGDSVQGPQNLLQVEELACGKGCFPYLPQGQVLTLSNDGANSQTHGGAVIQTSTHTGNLPYVTESGPADYNNYECGRRGKCNYGTGLCECFDGYTGESCSVQTALL